MSTIYSIDHNCYDYYEHKNGDKIFSCDGCKMKGYGNFYRCSHCGNNLHIECGYLFSTISHDFFGDSIFQFHRTPLTRLGRNNRIEFSKCCDACGKDIHGFSYRCEEKDKDLHPCCKSLKKHIRVKDIDFYLQDGVLSKCMRCRKKKITDGDRDVRGWSFISSCNKYHLHVFCMVELVHEVCMKYGETGLDKVDLRVATSRGWQGSKKFEMIKSMVKILLSVILGDPTMFISNMFVELISRGLQ